MNYSAKSNKSALNSLLDDVNSQYPNNKELNFTASRFYDNKYKFKFRISFAEIKDALSKKLEKTCDKETANKIVKNFKRLLKNEEDKKQLLTIAQVTT